ncbi:MAG: hypothetical protein Q9216_004605, partial [Gyalolechia sp. 2 TL-2023]
SPLMLKQTGCDIVELGHAERRAPPFNETDEIIASKAQAAVRNQLIPLVCIGERNRSSIASEGVGIAVRECSGQINAITDAVEGDRDIIFAYEPVWAIGAAEPAGKDHVVTVVQQLRKVVEDKRRTGAVRFLYGGSAGPGVWSGLKEGVDGLFLGRFAHDVANVERNRELRFHSVDIKGLMVPMARWAIAVKNFVDTLHGETYGTMEDEVDNAGKREQYVLTTLTTAYHGNVQDFDRGNAGI